MDGELWQWTGTGLAALIAASEVSSREVVDAHLDRIEAVNPHLNAVVHVMAGEARASADAADAAVAAGDPLGPLHGVPFTVKDNLDVAGAPTTAGLVRFADSMAVRDDPITERLRVAGGIPLGKTNLPELAMRLATDNPLFGLTRNPWHPDCTAGGSSGGDASAVAAGMTPLGVGTDLGGSVRNPAYCCGIATTKTSLGRLPTAGSSPSAALPYLGRQLMAVAGPMARSVADLEAMLRATIGRHPRDPRSVDAPFDGPPVARRVAFCAEVPGGPTHPDQVAAVHAAAAALDAVGWEVVEVLPPEMEQCYKVWGHVLATDIPRTLDDYTGTISDEGAHLLRHSANRWTDAAMPPQVAQQERYRLGRLWAEFLDEHPVLLLPTWCSRPFCHDDDLTDDLTALDDLYDGVFRPITPANLLGLPSTQVPAGVADGLPLGVQCYADLHREDLTLAAAGDIEAALGTITPIDPAT